MTEQEILSMWYKGYNRLKLAEIYKFRYNQQVKIIRLDMKNRHVKFITYNEALNKVEITIFNELKKKKI